MKRRDFLKQLAAGVAAAGVIAKTGSDALADITAEELAAGPVPEPPVIQQHLPLPKKLGKPIHLSMFNEHLEKKAADSLYPSMFAMRGKPDYNPDATGKWSENAVEQCAKHLDTKTPPQTLTGLFNQHLTQAAIAGLPRDCTNVQAGLVVGTASMDPLTARSRLNLTATRDGRVFSDVMLFSDMDTAPVKEQVAVFTDTLHQMTHRMKQEMVNGALADMHQSVMDNPEAIGMSSRAWLSG
jgi:hypothetical protein